MQNSQIALIYRQCALRLPQRKDFDMMKRISLILLAVALLVTATACQKKPQTVEVTTTAATTEPTIPGDTILSSDDYDLDFTQYLDVPDLSAVKVQLSEVEQAWEDFALTIRTEYTTYAEASADATAALYDQVNIHYKGYAADANVVLSEDTLEGMTNFDYNENGYLLEGYDLVLGSGSFIRAYESEEHPEKNNKGFEEQLVGAKVGETRTITVTFPDNYGSDELNGTVVKFDVTINSIQKGTLPELTDALVADYTSEEYTTIDGLKKYVTDFYRSDLAYTAVEKVIKIKEYPQNLIDKYIAEYMESYIAANYDEELTEEETQKVYDEQRPAALERAEQQIGERLKLEYLFKEFNVTLTQSEYIETRDADYEQNAFYYVYYYGLSDAEALEEAFTKDTLIAQYKFDKLKTVLEKNVTFE